MTSDRLIGHAPRTRALASSLVGLQGPCIGCSTCQGVCEALIEALILPEVILRDRAT